MTLDSIILRYPNGEKTVLVKGAISVTEINYSNHGESYIRSHRCPLLKPHQIYKYLIDLHTSIFDENQPGGIVPPCYSIYNRGEDREIY